MRTVNSPLALVTGNSGSVGRWVSDTLIDRDWSVVGIGHGQNHLTLAERSRLAVCRDSSISLSELRSLNIRPDLIIHCAGSGSVGASISAPHNDFLRTVGTTLDVLEFMRTDCPQARLLYPSSAAVYGVCEVMPMAENLSLAPASPYGVHKKIAEELIAEYGRTYSLNVAVVRLFSIYGEGFRKQLLWDACQKISRGDLQFFGTGDETRDWLHASDAAELMILSSSLASPSCPILNGGAGAAVTVREVLSELCRLLDVDAPIGFCGTQRPGDPVHYCADVHKALALDWKPRITLGEGLSRYVKWFLQEQAGARSC